MSTQEVVHGDCVELMRRLPDACIDAIVTDPPYDLTANKKGGSGVASINLDSPYGRARIGTGKGSGGFMGKAWDSTGIAFTPELWREALRVLKPGGYLLAFGGTRTYHRMTCAIEDAGFEIRDCIQWIYGSGFPKSLDVSKAIDKAGGQATRTQAELLRKKRENSGLTREEVAERVGCTPSSVRDWEEGRSRSRGSALEYIVPCSEYRDKLADLFDYSLDERRLVGQATDRRGDGTVYTVGHSGNLHSGGNTDAARKWQGFGTALKPANEPIVVARKPLEGTVADNVQKWGTGALNIDGCRIDYRSEADKTSAFPGGKLTSHGSGSLAGPGAAQDARRSGFESQQSSGRWPANVLLDEGAAAELDRQSGVRKGLGYHGASGDGGPAIQGSEGYASRFFYVAKPATSEREAGLDALEDKRANVHPTVKPITLMRYLVRLVTPPSGVVLDPFGGSGTTGCAAALEDFNCILMEGEEEYVKIAEARIAHWQKSNSKKP